MKKFIPVLIVLAVILTASSCVINITSDETGTVRFINDEDIVIDEICLRYADNNKEVPGTFRTNNLYEDDSCSWDVDDDTYYISILCDNGSGYVSANFTISGNTKTYKFSDAECID